MVFISDLGSILNTCDLELSPFKNISSLVLKSVMFLKTVRVMVVLLVVFLGVCGGECIGARQLLGFWW